MLGAVGLVVIGLVLLVVASDRLVVSAVRVARALGVSAILVGAVVVGLGTSIPELLVSAIASGNDELDVAMANVVGSNVANVTLVLGTAALISPVMARHSTLRREGVLMVVAVLGLTVVLVDGQVGGFEGVALVGGLVVALVLLVVWSIGAEEFDAEVDGLVTTRRGIAIELLVGLGSLVLTVAAADLLLDGALEIGERLRWSDTFLGLLLGVGTSLPELATALAAARRGESDLVVGNVVGSNIFNSLAVAGTAGIVGPAVLTDLGTLPVVVMVVTAVVAGAFSRTGERIVRLEGAALVAVFVIFGLVAF